MNKKIFALVMAMMLLVCCACGGSKGTRSLENFEETDQFINDVYAGYEGELPMMLMQTELPLDDAEMLSFNTGISDTEGIKHVIVSESGIGSIAYSMVYVVTEEGADAEGIRKQIADNINPAKWLCVTAEKMVSFTMGEDVFFVMGEAAMVDSLVELAVEQAEALGFEVGAKNEKLNNI